MTNVYLQVGTEVAMLMQIRALRDSDLQRDRLVQKLECSRHDTGGRCFTDVGACYHSLQDLLPRDLSSVHFQDLYHLLWDHPWLHPQQYLLCH